jgi:hypothetical protein
LGRRGILRGRSAACSEGHEREDKNCRPAHEGECGQSRALSVYVNSHGRQSAFQDADSSDNWMLPEGAEPPIRQDRLSKLRKNFCRAAKRERARLDSLLKNSASRAKRERARLQSCRRCCKTREGLTGCGKTLQVGRNVKGHDFSRAVNAAI